MLDRRLQPAVADEHFLEFVVVIRAPVEPFFEMVKFALHIAQFRNRVRREFEQRPRDFAVRKMLLENAQPHIFRNADRTAVRHDIAGDDAENRTFAGPVRADYADPVAGVDPEGRGIENHFPRISFCHILEINHSRTRDILL